MFFYNEPKILPCLLHKKLKVSWSFTRLVVNRHSKDLVRVFHSVKSQLLSRRGNESGNCLLVVFLLIIATIEYIFLSTLIRRCINDKNKK